MPFFDWLLGHFFLLDLVVDDVTGGELAMDILKRDAHLNHQDHYVVGKIGNFVNGFLFVICFTRNNDLSTFLTNLFEDLIYSLFKKVSGVRALRSILLSSLKKSVKSLKGKL